MSVPVGELIARADTAVSGLGHAPSTLWQYRWAWSQVKLFCSQRGAVELTDDASMFVKPPQAAAGTMGSAVAGWAAVRVR